MDTTTEIIRRIAAIERRLDVLATTEHTNSSIGGSWHSPVTLDTNADTLLSITGQALGLDTQTANRVFAGPSSGAAAVPTFRALVSDDIPTLDHGAKLTGLSDDDHTQYALLAGRSGGQVMYGGTAANNDLMLTPTSHATGGTIIIKGSSAQSDNLTEWQTSAGTVTAYIDPYGTAKFNPQRTDPSATVRASWSYAILTCDTAGGNQTHIAIDGQLDLYGAQNYTAEQRGFTGFAYHRGSGVASALIGGLFGIGGRSTGNITTAYGLDIRTFNSVGTSVISSLSMVHIADMSAYNTPTYAYGVNIAASTGAVGTAKYGINIGDLSGATSNYAIYTGAGAVSIGDHVAYRTATAPSAAADRAKTWSADQASEAGNCALHVISETGDITSIGNRIITTGGLVVNSGGASASTYDTQIQSDTESNMVFLDSSADYIYLGGTTNGVRIAKGGELELIGTATRWDDLRVEAVARGVAGAKTPAFEQYADDSGLGDTGTTPGVYLYSFDDAAAAGEKEVFFTMQLPHSWASTGIYIHVHWIGNTADTTSAPRWGLEYTWKEIGATFGATTTVYSDGTNYTSGAGGDANITAGKHYISKFSVLTPDTTQDGISSILIGRLFRNSSSASDTYDAAGNKCGLLYVDAHYEINDFGSSSEYVK